LITRQLTRRLERLAATADAVSRGDLGAHLDERGNDEMGRVARAFNTMTSSLRRTLDELAARERLAAVGEFAATLAHEVRNPLTAIRLDLQQVEESLPPESPLRESQSRALKEIARLDATVADTLDAAKTHPGAPAAIDLRSPLEAAADAAAPAFAARRAILERSRLSEVSLRVLGDPRPLEQLFLNLLLNAASALGPGRQAWIEVHESGSEAIVEVHDAGTGIPEDVLPRVFEPLYSTRADGTGLGLTVARRIVQAHKGTIQIESAVGKGTIVRVRLPRAMPAS
jgi:signal transduction histidine kinase